MPPSKLYHSDMKCKYFTKYQQYSKLLDQNGNLRVYVDKKNKLLPVTRQKIYGIYQDLGILKRSKTSNFGIER